MNYTTDGTLENILSRLEGVAKTANGWQARCPAHDDRHASLSITFASGKILLHDHAGCACESIVSAIGLTMGDLHPDSATSSRNPNKRKFPFPEDKDAWTPIVPIPNDTPTPFHSHPKHGEATHAWTYRNDRGDVLCHIYRFDTAGGKQILPLTYCKDGNGKRQWRWKGLPEPRPLYNLDQLVAKPDAVVIVTEGEKAADAASRLFPDCVATTSMHGAKAQDKTDWKPLAGRTVWMWADNDKAGSLYIESVAKLINPLECELKVINNKWLTKVIGKVLDAGYDAADAESDGLTAENFRKAIDEWREKHNNFHRKPEPEASEDYERRLQALNACFLRDCVVLDGALFGGDDDEEQGIVAETLRARVVAATDGASTLTGEEPGGGSADHAAYERLARLSRADYDRVRVEEAEKLGIRVSTLDAEVGRTRDNTDEDGAQGKIFEFKHIEPWSEPVVGVQLLEALEAYFRRFLVTPENAFVALPLWTLHSYLMDVTDATPYLAFTSPEKRCGKSRALTVVSLICSKPLIVVNLNPAVLFRIIEKHSPTMLIEEFDTFSANEELRGILNAGYTRDTAQVPRCIGEDHEPRVFSVWAPKAFTLIGKLPNTLEDRSIVIRMQRKLVSEKIERLRSKHYDRFKPLAAKCLRFAEDNRAVLRDMEPALPDELNDRAQDVWEPLLAIADVAGGEWPARARKAALGLSEGVEVDAQSYGVQLLADIQHVFGGVESLLSADLVNKLCGLEDRPWREFSRGKPLTGQKLASILKSYQIRSTHKRGGNVYLLTQFKEAFERYIPYVSTTTPFQTVTPSQWQEEQELTSFSNRHTDCGCDGLKSGISPSNISTCDGVTVQKGGDCEGMPIPTQNGGVTADTSYIPLGAGTKLGASGHTFVRCRECEHYLADTKTCAINAQGPGVTLEPTTARVCAHHREALAEREDEALVDAETEARAERAAIQAESEPSSKGCGQPRPSKPWAPPLPRGFPWRRRAPSEAARMDTLPTS
jgi:DNA primase (bacterial type)